MKTFLKFAGLISLGLAVVGFILVMSTHSVVYTSSPADNWYSATSAIFGGGTAQITLSGWGITISSGVQNVDAKGAWCALLSWIFVLVGLLGLIAGVVLPLLKVKGFNRFAGLVNLCSAGLLLVGGIFLFFTVSAFGAANEWNNTNGWGLGGGWVVAAILYIAAGAVAVFPAAVGLIEKK